MGFGIALGGVASGLESAENARRQNEELELRKRAIAQDSELRNKALAIQDAQLKRQDKNDLLSQADDIIGKQLKVVQDTIKAGKEAGQPVSAIAAAIEPLLADVDKLSGAVGRDGSIYRKQVDAALTAPTAMEAATAEGEAAGKAAVVKDQTMRAAGVVPSGADNTLEQIKATIAAKGFEALTPGQRQLYQDSLKQSSQGVVDLIKALSGGGGEVPVTPVKTETIAAPGASPPVGPSGIPAVPAALAGKGAKWSPSKQRWYLPDGSAYNQQGVPSG
jgi:hypothetical protein